VPDDYVSWAGPVFLDLIAVELFVGHRRGVSHCRVNETVGDISTGLLMQSSRLPARGLRDVFVFQYFYLDRHHGGGNLHHLGSPLWNL